MNLTSVMILFIPIIDGDLKKLIHYYYAKDIFMNFYDIILKCNKTYVMILLIHELVVNR